MSDTPQMSPLDMLLGGADSANPEFVAKAEAILAMFDMPRSGQDGAMVAAACAAGVLLVDLMAKMAVVHGVMASSTGAAIEGLVARAQEAWSALAVREAGNGEGRDAAAQETAG